MKFSREIGNVTRIDESSLFLEGQNREVKMSIKEHKWKVITGILLELVIDHNFIPASELSQIPLIRLYLLIPPSPRLVSKFFTRWKLFETNTYIYINYYFLKSIYNKFHKHSFFYKDEEKVAILRIYSQNQNDLNLLRKCFVQ